MATLKKPYLLFLGDVEQPPFAKTAYGLRDWAGEDVVGQHRLDGCRIDLGLEDLGYRDAAARGARSLVIGAAPVGGALPDRWLASLVEAIEAGLDIVSGLHERLSQRPALVEAAARAGVALHDVREPGRTFPIATGRKRTGLRLLTVGADCALGKKYAALAVARALRQAGVKATFRATGQTGIMIAGAGVPMDAVISDFLAGAAETLSPDNDPDHWDIIEGQGSLFHPAYAGVSMGLLHGSQPDAIVVCHDPDRRSLLGFPKFTAADPAAVIARALLEGRTTNPAIACVGVSVNSARLDDSQRKLLFAALERELSVPVFDPIRDGAGALVPGLCDTFRQSGHRA